MPRKDKKGGGKAKGKKGGASSAGGASVADIKEALVAALTRALNDEDGGDDGYDLDSAGGVECIVELAMDEAEGAIKDGNGATGLWDLAPDAADMVRDAGGSDEVLEALAGEVVGPLGALIAALTTGPQYEAGAPCVALMPADAQWHDAVIVSFDEASEVVRVRFTQYGNEEDLLPDHVQVEGGEGGADGACCLCGREMPLGAYHLVPTSQHARLKKKGASMEELEAVCQMCAPCRKACKEAEDDATMAADYATLEALKEHPKIAEFAAWVAKEKTTVGKAGSYGS